MKGNRSKTLSFLLLSAVFLCLFLSSSIGFQTQHKAFIRSNSEVHETGLLFQNPELDPDAVKGGEYIKSLGMEPLSEESHFNTAYLPPVNSQGSQGSCVAWAVGYYLKSYQENKEKSRTSEAERGLAQNISSPAFIYNMIHAKDDKGAYFSDAFQVLNDFGCASLADMPYDDSDYQTWPDENDFENAVPQRSLCSSGDYYYLFLGSDSELNQLKQMILAGKLAVFGIYVYDNFDHISSYDNIYTLADKSGSSRGGHAQTIVGYDDNKVTNDGVGAFRVVNSWGSGWGDNGFYWISYEAIKFSSDLSQGYAIWVDDRTDYSSNKKIRFQFSHNYSRETDSWISAGGAQKDFLDFYVNSQYEEYLNFPSSKIVLDVKDIESYIQEGTTLYLYMKDKVANGAEGIITDFMYEDSSARIDLCSSDTPVGISDSSQGYASITIPSSSMPFIECSRDHLYYGADTLNTKTSSQNILISNAGAGTLNWTVSDDAGWLSCSPGSGAGTAAVSVSVDAAGLSAGVYYGTVSVSDPSASNSPQSVDVTLQVYTAGTTQPPIGYWDTPVDGATQVRGQIPVTGWALDDIEVDRVEIWRRYEPEDPPEAQNSEGLVFVGEALFVEGARPNLETDPPYNGYPLNYKGGWGYMMLTYGLARRGNGTYVLHAFAWDVEGNRTDLGTKTITCDNDNAVKPFGTLDTPAPGMTFPHETYGNINFGWVLTPQPKSIPFDGSTIFVYIDGELKGNVDEYGNYSASVAEMFPDYANTDNSYGHYFIDLGSYENGVHTIQWTAYDSDGVGEGIGSRYFNIQNTGGAAAEAKSLVENLGSVSGLTSIPEDSSGYVGVKRGYADAKLQRFYPDERGVVNVEMEEAGRVEIHLMDLMGNEALIADIIGSQYSEVHYEGYLIVGQELRPLPIGSALDKDKGIFYWMPGAGFLGEYDFVFVRESLILQKEKTRVKISIKSKFD